MSPSMLIDALIRATVQGTAAIVAVWGLLAVWRRCPHHVRCWLWRLAFAKMILGVVLLSPLTFGVLPQQAYPVHNVLATESAPIQGYASVEMGETVELGPNAAANPSAVPDLPSPPMRITVWQVIAWVWCLGAAIVLALTLVSVAKSRQMLAACRHVNDAGLRRELETLCGQAGLRRVPELFVSDSGGPMVVGMIRPAIVLPESYLDESRLDDVRLILAHEVAHITRRDLAWELLPTLARIAFFFNPFVYAANDQAGLAREMACDAAALRLTGASNTQYARMLLDCVASGRAGVTCVRMAEAYGAIRSRILSVANPIRVSPGRLALIAALIVIAAAALIVPWSLTPVSNPAASASAAVKDTYEGLSLIPGTYKLTWDLRDPRDSEPDFYSAEPVSPKVRAKLIGRLSSTALSCGLNGFMVIADESRGRGTGYDVAYVFSQSWLEAGRKADLRKAWRVPLKNEGDMFINDRFIAKLTLGAGSDIAVRNAEFSLIVQPPSDRKKNGQVSFKWRGGWYGNIKTTKGTLELHPDDYNRDFVYNTPKSPGYLCPICGEYHDGISDSLSIDGLDSSSGLDGNYVEGWSPACGIGIVAGKPYDIKVSPAGDSVRVEPYSGPAGTLKIDAIDGFSKPAGFSVSLRKTEHNSDVSGIVSGIGSRLIDLPPGEYSASVTMGIPDAKDDGCHGLSYDLPHMQVRQSATSTLSLGGALKLHIGPSARPLTATKGTKQMITVYSTLPHAHRPQLSGVSERRLSIRVTDSRGAVVKVLDVDPSTSCVFGAMNVIDAGSLEPGAYTISASCDFTPYSPKSSVSAEITVKE